MKALFDISFTKFVTPSILKVLYILFMIGLGIMYIVIVVAAFYESTGMGLATMFIFGPLVVLVYLALIRASLESLIAQIRTAENTAELVRLSGGSASGFDQPGPGSYPGPQAGPNPGPNSGPQNPYQH
ncbi:hypothetical protein AUR04nite_07750 [Glutamicibacter uratoxydans]|uniref:DUF4282 domain-containing protein n=1 Tax=Glutamicibacter uratoxydans TaxID=43667 RepID=A0A4Y4DKX0_GLUUR|nr:DUF4282 domain-containing protein [Glutamicibacter uratoxydans]GED05243.1 hypothetical protein AUR04nite_07750 [Glutamicibacter uratoxydans]